MILKLHSLVNVFRPASAPSLSDEPLLIVLHGRGDSPEGFAWLPDILNMPRLNYLFLQAPDDYYGGFSWYDMPPDQLPGILRSRELLNSVFAEIEAQKVDFKNVFLMGFSQGCLMTFEFGSRHKKVLGGYIGLSGYVYDPASILTEAYEPAKMGDWLITHGTHDEVLPIARTRGQIKELIQGGFKIKYLEYEKAHTLDEVNELPMLKAWLSARIENSEGIPSRKTLP